MIYLQCQDPSPPSRLDRGVCGTLLSLGVATHFLPELPCQRSTSVKNLVFRPSFPLQLLACNHNVAASASFIIYSSPPPPPPPPTLLPIAFARSRAWVAGDERKYK